MGSRFPGTPYLLLPAVHCGPADDEERVIQLDDQLTLPHPPRLPPFQRLISSNFHNGSMYEYVRSILAPGYFPLTYRPLLDSLLDRYRIDFRSISTVV